MNTPQTFIALLGLALFVKQAIGWGVPCIPTIRRVAIVFWLSGWVTIPLTFCLGNIYLALWLMLASIVSSINIMLTYDEIEIESSR